MPKSSRRAIPRFSTPLIETHCHLDYLESQPLDEILRQSHSAGIERIITIAVSEKNLECVMSLCNSLTTVWGTQGIHPHEAQDYNPEVADRIRANAQHERIVAIGEIGLDYYYDNAPRNEQCAAFDAQLALATDLDLPVVIHTRDADKDTQSILQNHSKTLRRKGVIHSFTSSLTLAKFCLQEGFMLGFNGIATFKTAENVRDVVALTPPDRLLLETDAPYLTPVPYRGKPNAPFYLPFIAEHIASVKAMEAEALLEQVYRNSIELFFSQEAEN